MGSTAYFSDSGILIFVIYIFFVGFLVCQCIFMPNSASIKSIFIYFAYGVYLWETLKIDKPVNNTLNMVETSCMDFDYYEIPKSIITKTFDKKIGKIEYNNEKKIDENKEVPQYFITFVDVSAYPTTVFEYLSRESVNSMLINDCDVSKLCRERVFFIENYKFKIDTEGNLYETLKINDSGEFYRDKDFKIVYV